MRLVIRKKRARVHFSGKPTMCQRAHSDSFRVADNAEPIQFHQSVRNLDASSLWKLHRRVLLGMIISEPQPISGACFISTWIFGGRRTSFLKTMQSNAL
jgi:hypothetical protein